MADTKEKVICPWCKEEMRPYPHQGYYWFQCKCGARTPTLWHATEEQAHKKALSYIADVVPKSEYDRLEKLYNDMTQEAKGYLNRLYGIRAEVAREIFEEIEEHMVVFGDINLSTYFRGIGWKVFAQLKKKYTEEKE